MTNIVIIIIASITLIWGFFCTIYNLHIISLHEPKIIRDVKIIKCFYDCFGNYLNTICNNWSLQQKCWINIIVNDLDYSNIPPIMVFCLNKWMNNTPEAQFFIYVYKEKKRIDKLINKLEKRNINWQEYYQNVININNT